MNTLPHQRLWLKVALKFTARYQANAAQKQQLKSPPRSCWERVLRWERLYQKASQREYRAAMRICQERLQQSLSQIIHECTTYREEITQSCSHASVPPLQVLYEELCALVGEFESVVIDWDEEEVVVLTQSLRLEHIDLGAFEIRLRWSEIGAAQPYRIISLAQTGEDDVHHPHVQEEALCEGEGKVPLHRALATGRLCDFFLLVQQVLKTYNPGSAYVPLSRWFSVSCADCGDAVSREESSSCSVCEHDVCGYCRRNCTSCGTTLCSSCVDTCSACDDRFCRDCLFTCDGCSECCCRPCLSSETCPACLKESEEDSHAPSENTSLNTSLNTSPDSSLKAETPAAKETASVEI